MVWVGGAILFIVGMIAGFALAVWILISGSIKGMLPW